MPIPLSRAGAAALATLMLASLYTATVPAHAASATTLATTTATPGPGIPVGPDGTVATDATFDGPRVTKARVIEEGKFLEIYWDRYVDEVAAVDPSNITLTNGARTIVLTPKPATGPTDTIFFDKDNRQIAATPANSMARLPEGLHMASIAYTGTIDTSLPLTLEVTGSAIEDSQGRPATDATYIGVPTLSYYTQSARTRTGIVVKADERVRPETVDMAAAQVEVALGKEDTGIAANMATHSCSLAVYAARENAYLVPEHRSGYDPTMYDVEGYGGSTWNNCVSSISERNVLRTRGDENAFLNTRYPNENILVHEFAHAIRLVGIETMKNKGLSKDLSATYQHSKSTGRFPNTYAMSNIDEYFATLSTIWFDVMAEKPDWNDGVRGPINTRAELREYDPRAYAFFAKVYPSDATLPAPWDVPAPDIYHSGHTVTPRDAN